MEFLLHSAWEGEPFDRFRLMQLSLLLSGPEWAAKNDWNANRIYA